MKVIYYHPRHLTASFIAAYLHTSKDDAPIDLTKIGEILRGFRQDKPFILYFGRGKEGEEVFILNGDCAERIIRRTINNLLSAFGRKPAGLLLVNPLSGRQVLLQFAEALGIPRIEEAIYRNYLAEIKATVERSFLQLQT